VYKTKAVGAKKGHELLKKKSDALKKAFNGVLQKIVEAKVRMGSDYREALLGLAGATFAAGDFSRAVTDNVKTKTSVRLGVHFDNIAGVHLPIFTLKGEDEQSDETALLGLSGGGSAILGAREKFTKFLKILITIASLQTQFVTVDQALKVTNRRVNALEFVLIPRINNTIAYIKDELDEEAREDFTRLKKVTDAKKERKKEEFEALEKAHGGGGNKPGEEDIIPSNFKEGDDEDEEIFV
jgi:V-type H+-transporting ATPase subunit D